VVFDILQSENITGKVKASDLATPVARHPPCANGTANDFVNVFSKIVFANYLAFASVGPDNTNTRNGCVWARMLFNRTKRLTLRI